MCLDGKQNLGKVMSNGNNHVLMKELTTGSTNIYIFRIYLHHEYIHEKKKNGFMRPSLPVYNQLNKTRKVNSASSCFELEIHHFKA